MAPVRRSTRGKKTEKTIDEETSGEDKTVQSGLEKLKAARVEKEKKNESSSDSQSGSQSPESSVEKTVEEGVDLSKLTKREFLNRGPLMFVISLGMKEINKTKPEDPIAALGQFLMQYKDLHKNSDWKNVIPTNHYNIV